MACSGRRWRWCGTRRCGHATVHVVGSGPMMAFFDRRQVRLAVQTARKRSATPPASSRGAPLRWRTSCRLGYPTQKPEALLERIIEAASNEGDVVLDPFCGCGTAVAVAQRMRRRWIGVDITFFAVDLIDKRLRDTYGEGVRSTYEVRGIPRDLDGARALFASNPFDFERWAVSLVGGQPHERHEQAGDRGVDGWVRFPANAAETGRVVVSVKGGRQLNPAMVRDLRGTTESQRAQMGLLVTLESPTRGMRDEARRSGTYIHPLTGRAYPLLQVVTIAELL
ncbi:MAG: restriction endonuclease subunit M, partial [Nitriliruptorales bacterium]|nr:restriction endonuclease subunit M [Nitriliruptorales bacterium]